MIDISDLDEASVLAELYNRAQPLGLGFLHYTPESMSRDEAAKLLSQQRDFDYLKGRVMKVGFFDARRSLHEGNQPGQLRGDGLYDRDNGDGAVASVLAKLRAATSAAE